MLPLLIDITKARKGEHVGGKYILRWWKSERWNYKYSDLQNPNHGPASTATEKHTIDVHPQSLRSEHSPEQAFHYARHQALRGTKEHTAVILSKKGAPKYKVLVRPSSVRPIIILPPNSNQAQDAITTLPNFASLDNWAHRRRTTRTVRDAQGKPWFELRDRGPTRDNPSGKMSVRYCASSPHNPFPGEPPQWAASPFTKETAKEWIKEQRRQQRASGQRVKPAKRFPIDRDRPATTALEQGRITWTRVRKPYSIVFHERTGKTTQRRGTRPIRHAQFKSDEDRKNFYAKVVKEHFGQIVLYAERQLKMYNIFDVEQMARLLGYYGGPGRSSNIQIEPESPTMTAVERAVNSYDPEKGWKFNTYLGHCLWWENFKETKKILGELKERQKMVTTLDHSGHTHDVITNLQRKDMHPDHEAIVSVGAHTGEPDVNLLAKQEKLKDWSTRQEDKIARFTAAAGDDHERQVTSFLAATDLHEIKSPEQAQAFIAHWQSDGGDEFVEPYEAEEVSRPKVKIPASEKKSWVTMVTEHPLLSSAEKAALLTFAPKGDLQNIRPFTEVSLELAKKHSKEFSRPPSEHQLVDIFLSAHQKLAGLPEFEAMQAKLSPVMKAINLIRKLQLDKISQASDILRKAKKGEKVQGYKYWKREGVPGHYKYYYHDAKGNIIEGTNAPEDHKHHQPSLGSPQVAKNEPTQKENPEYFDAKGRKMNRAVPDHAEWNPEYDKDTHSKRWAARWPKEDGSDYEYGYPDSDVQENKELSINTSNKHLDEQLPKVRKAYKSLMGSDALSDRALGLMVALLDQAFMRVGKKAHEQATGHVALVSLKKSNVSVKGNVVSFSYIGKRGMEQNQNVVLDSKAMGIVKDLLTAPGKKDKDYFFSVPVKRGGRTKYQEIGYNKLVRNLQSLGVQAKQFRSYHGTRLYSEYFEELAEKIKGKPTGQMLDKISEAAAMKVAAALGHFKKEGEDQKTHTANAFSSYIDPVVVKTLYLNSLHPDFNKSIEEVEKSHPVEEKVSYDGVKIDIENKKGSTRNWYDPNEDKEGKTRMNYDYGFIPHTEGVDGDGVDVYIGPSKDSARVFVIRQMKGPDFKKYDEDKVMMGFSSPEEAKAAYMKQYDDPKFFGDMKEMTIPELKEKIKDKKYEGKMLKCVSLG